MKSSISNSFLLDTVEGDLVSSYCIPSLLYGCEIWDFTLSDYRKMNVIWNNALYETMLLRRYFSAAGVKVLHVFSITVEYYHYLT